MQFLATSYLTVPEMLGDSALRIVEETFWRQFVSIRDVSVAAFTTPRPQLGSELAAEHKDLLRAAGEVVAEMIAGRSPLGLAYTATDYSRFAKLERKGKTAGLEIYPDQDTAEQRSRLENAQVNFRQVSAFARTWEILAAAKLANLTSTERLRMVQDRDRLMIRICYKRSLTRGQPILVLDADADETILSALDCTVHETHDITLRPNARIIQLHDRRMTKARLLSSKDLREDWRRIIAREVLIDRLGPGGGVLVGASKQVVRKFFEDAGHRFDGMNDDEVVEVMLNTRLHGAHWLWFGGRALGSNRYTDCSAVIVIGREELPVQVLEDQGRALWGDTPGSPLVLVSPDANGNLLLPEEEVPYEMADGSARAVMVPCHPDPRIRRLQRQNRELATRQLVERLRLARSVYPKRVILGSNIPIPGLPVERLVAWADLVPTRLDAAITDGLLVHGEIRLSPTGLAEGAPKVFSSAEAARCYLKRNRGLDPATFVERLPNGCGNRVRLDEFAPTARYARREKMLRLADRPAEPR